MIAFDAIVWTLGSVLVALAFIAAITWLTRDRRNRKLRLGFFLERERFNHEDDESSNHERPP